MKTDIAGEARTPEPPVAEVDVSDDGPGQAIDSTDSAS